MFETTFPYAGRTFRLVVADEARPCEVDLRQTEPVITACRETSLWTLLEALEEANRHMQPGPRVRKLRGERAPELLPAQELPAVVKGFNGAMRKIMGDAWEPAPLLPDEFEFRKSAAVCCHCGKVYRVSCRVREHLAKKHGIKQMDLEGHVVWRTPEGGTR